MKNKFFILQIVFLFKILLANSLADEFKLNSKSLEVLNKGDIVKASGEVEIVTDNNLIIKSDNSVINKKDKYLEANGNVSLNLKQSWFDISRLLSFRSNLRICFGADYVIVVFTNC